MVVEVVYNVVFLIGTVSLRRSLGLRGRTGLNG